jgi:hypothetical protein
MKAIVFLAFMICLVLGGIALYNAWWAEANPVAIAPGLVEQGRLDLHAKLVQGEQREAEIEKTYWHSAEKLQILIKSHRRRIEELNGNRASAEIVAHDKDAIARLEKRIAEIEAEWAAKEEAAAEKAKAEAQARRIAAR